MSLTDDGSDCLLRSPFLVVKGSVSLPVGALPAASLAVLPKANLNMLVAVMPAAALAEARLRSRALASVGGRLATVLAAEDLAIQCPFVALLSPSLGVSCRKQSGRRGASGEIVSVQRMHGPLCSIERVTIVAMPHGETPSAAVDASRVADGAKAMLLGRSVVVGDILAISIDSWAMVTDVSFLSSRNQRDSVVVGVVDSGTDVALHVGGRTPLFVVSQALRTWAFTHWSSSLPRWNWGEYAKELERCTESYWFTPRPIVVAAVGLVRDVRDVVRCFSVARIFFEIDGRSSSQKDFAETMARAELAGIRHDVIVFVHHADRFSDGCTDILDGEVRMESTEGFVSEIAEHGGPNSRIVVVVGCENIDDLSPPLRALLLNEVKIAPASEQERQSLLASVNELGLPKMTVGFSRTEVLGLRRVVLEFGGLPAASDAVRRFGKGKLTVRAGNVRWEDVGGLESAKEEIMQLVQLPPSIGDSPANAMPMRRVGILLHGPPGTGKTLIAKAVAGECGCSFISVKGPELLDMYVGESERNVRELFSRAELAAPCVVFFDEIDALAPARGRGGSDAGGVAERVVSQLLAEIDAAANQRGVFIIAATNRPDLVDPSILRPGRFDKLVYVPTPESRQAQKTVLAALTRKFTLSDDVDLDRALLEAPEPPLLSGADLYAMVADAWLSAARRHISTSEAENEESERKNVEGVGSICCEDLLNRGRSQERMAGRFVLERRQVVEECNSLAAGPSAAQVVVSQEDLLNAASRVRPSLSPEELASYARLRGRDEEIE